MSTNESITANIGGGDDLGLSTDRELLLMEANQERQANRQEQIRANAVAEAKQHWGADAAEWVANSFAVLDNAVVRGYRMGGGGPTSLAANNQILDFDEHELRDDDVLQDVRTNLTMMESVMAAGFTRDASLARTEYIKQRTGRWQNTGQISMDGRAESTGDERNKERFGVPIPIVHCDYEIPARRQQQSQNFGESIEDEQAEESGRILRETEENLFLSGWGPTTPDSQGNNLDLYGIRDSTVSITGSATGDWGTADNIKDTIDAILNDLESQTADNDRGPDPVEQGAWLWYHPNQRSDLRAADPDGDGNMTVMTRLQQDYPYLDMQAAGELDDGELVCLVKDPRFCRILTAQAPTNLSEETDMGLCTKYKTLASRIPFFKTTYSGVKGAVYYTGA